MEDDVEKKISDEIDYIENFIKSELEKGEGVCKKTEEELLSCLEKNDLIGFFCDERGIPNFEEYSSGRRIKPFDEWSCFIEVVTRDGGALIIEFGGTKQLAYIIHKFSSEEVESYAKSHRVFMDKKHGLPRFVKIFEFKPSKI